jgi:hypothetical protein
MRGIPVGLVVKDRPEMHLSGAKLRRGQLSPRRPIYH